MTPAPPSIAEYKPLPGGALRITITPLVWIPIEQRAPGKRGGLSRSIARLPAYARLKLRQLKTDRDHI